VSGEAAPTESAEAPGRGRPRRHFSMIREFHLADLFTIMNGFLGAGALLAYMRFLIDRDAGFFWLGTALLPVALVMDVLDGRIARRRGVASPFGQELDSLADAVSFGVGPAAMGFAAGLRGGWDALCLIYFVGCGISRLARYNVTAEALSDPAAERGRAKVAYFEGLPIPSSLLLVVLLAVLAGTGRWQDALPGGTVDLGPFTLHPLAVLYFLHGSAMISKTLHVPKP
jgi:CDP-diacylglycerol--serine O-phosphatidyltransferase